MGQAENQAGVHDALVQMFRVGHAIGHGFVANDVKPVSERGCSKHEVAVIGRHDGHHVGAVATLRLGCQQYHPAGVAAIGRQADFLPGLD